MTEDRGALAIQEVLIQGDLSQLTPEQKLSYYLRVCETLKLNPYTRPFGYIKFRDGGEQLYTLKNATDQLRDIHHVSIVGLDRQRDADMVTVTAHGRLPDGRTDAAMGAVWIKGLGGELLANAIMKAETKAKRRLTLAICGLGWTDESEVDTIPGAQVFEGPALPEPGQGYVPIREVEADDLSPRRMITDEEDKVWKRWLVVRTEGLNHGVVVPSLSLPVSYSQLVSVATAVVDQTEDRKAKLAAQEDARDAARAAARTEREAKAPEQGGADPEPPAPQDGPPAPVQLADHWARNRALMAEAYAAGIKDVHELPNTATPEEVVARNIQLQEQLLGR